MTVFPHTLFPILPKKGRRHLAQIAVTDPMTTTSHDTLLLDVDCNGFGVSTNIVWTVYSWCHDDVTLCSCPSLSPRKAMVCPASIAVVTAVIWVVELKVGVAESGTALAMGFGVCSPPQGYSDSESLHMNGDRQISLVSSCSSEHGVCFGMFCKSFGIKLESIFCQHAAVYQNS